MTSSFTENRKRLHGIAIGLGLVLLLFVFDEPATPDPNRVSMFSSPGITAIAAAAGLFGLPMLAYIGGKFLDSRPRRRSIIWRVANVNLIVAAALLGFAIASSIYIPNYATEQLGTVIFFLAGGFGSIAADFVQHKMRGGVHGDET